MLVGDETSLFILRRDATVTMTSTQVCLPFVMSDIPDPGSRSFCISQTTKQLEGFVVRRGQHVYAYRNSCPHTGVTLNWSEHIFLDSTEEHIQCAMHGALFSLEDGRCIWGPCAGDFLETLELTTKATGQLFIDMAAKTP